jgi:putative transposase
VAFLSYRQLLEEIVRVRGVEVDHSGLNCWVLKYTPALDQIFRQRKRAVGISWRLDETYIRVEEQWKNLCWARDKNSHTVDFLLTAKRARKAALLFLRKSIDQSGLPGKVTIDGSNANAVAIEDYNIDIQTGIELRVAGLGPQAKYLNNIVEHNRSAIKRLPQSMLRFKSFWSALITLVGIEFMHMIHKGQLNGSGKSRPSQQFYSLAT